MLYKIKPTRMRGMKLSFLEEFLTKKMYILNLHPWKNGMVEKTISLFFKGFCMCADGF